jgi:nucleotidyltransferase AbiEii toxin of type IV toxin-antitoxin system
MSRAVSIRARLLELARKEHWDFQRLLLRYATGRFLWRLSQSEHADKFILKGAQLFVLWAGQPHRATRDLDLLGYGVDTPESIIRVFQAVSAIPSAPDDGLVWHGAEIKVESIRGAMNYTGQRVQLLATLANSRIPLQIDVGFGDTISPEPRRMEWPELLELPPASIRTYPPETVIAEKL